MKNILKLSIILFVFVSFSSNANAQCNNFAKKSCKPVLAPYVHDGIYNATVLSEGETAELFKTFYSGQDYRIVICGQEDMPNVEFQILDAERNVLYTNNEKDANKYWDFKLETSQQLIIAIQVQVSEAMEYKILEGCVAVLVGFYNIENSLE